MASECTSSHVEDLYPMFFADALSSRELLFAIDILPGTGEVTQEISPMLNHAQAQTLFGPR